MIKPSTFIKITFAIIIAGMLGILALVVTIDPFFHYHNPIPGFPYQIDNQLSQNPGMARHLCYDSVILGSSMTVNFESDLVGETMGDKPLKLPYNGAYPRDIRNIMELTKRPLKRVYLGLDLSSYTGDVDETKYPIPDYLYDKNPFNDVNYIYNKDVLLDYCLKPVVEWEPTKLSDVYSSEASLEGCYSREYVLSHYEIPERVDAYFPDDMFIEGLKANLETNIIPLIQEDENTEFVIFFPPYSILYWYEYIRINQMDAVLKAYGYAVETLLQRPNVKLFFFPGMEAVVTDLDIYADAGHYRQFINRYMTECFKTGEHRLTHDNYKRVLGDFADMIKSYDYDALLADKQG